MSELTPYSERISDFVSKYVVEGDSCWHLEGVSGRSVVLRKSKHINIRRAISWHVLGVDIKGKHVSMTCGDDLCVNPSHFDYKKEKARGPKKLLSHIKPRYVPPARGVRPGAKYSPPKGSAWRICRLDDPTADSFPCVYVIRCLLTGKKYVGKAKDYKRRIAQHSTHLNRGSHRNWRLQSDWDKFGGRHFKIEVLERCPVESISEREAFYIAEFSSESLYNIAGVPQ